MIVENGRALSGVECPSDAPAPQKPRGHVFIGKANPRGTAHVTLSAKALGGARPDALRINGRIFPLRAVTSPFAGPRGAQGGQLQFVADVPTSHQGKPTFSTAEVAAEVRLGDAWLPIVLEVTRLD